MLKHNIGLNGTLGTIKGTCADGILYLGMAPVVDGKASLMVTARREVFYNSACC